MWSKFLLLTLLGLFQTGLSVPWNENAEPMTLKSDPRDNNPVWTAEVRWTKDSPPTPKQVQGFARSGHQWVRKQPKAKTGKTGTILVFYHQAAQHHQTLGTNHLSGCCRV
jgi:hypothetical protein